MNGWGGENRTHLMPCSQGRWLAFGLRPKFGLVLGIEPSSPVSQTGVLPLNEHQHVWLRAVDSNHHRRLQRAQSCQLNERGMAPADGFEPPYPPSKGSVLPLNDAGSKSATAVDVAVVAVDGLESWRPRLESNQHPPLYGSGALPSSYGAASLCRRCLSSWALWLRAPESNRPCLAYETGLSTSSSAR
jgi:hypothetical protein